MENSDKVTVLVSALEERYKSMRSIRARVDQLCLWALGLLFGAAGWILFSATHITDDQKWLYVSGLCVAFLVLRFVYLADQMKGFKGQLRAAARIEKALKLHTPGFFDDSDQPIYEKKWSEAGTPTGDGNFFESSFALLYTGFAILIIVIMIRGCI